MCVRWILEKMGQFRTYNDINLANRLVKAQKELIEIKASQTYFMQSVRGFEVSQSGKYEFVSTNYGQYGLRAVLTFTGDKANKQVLFFPSFVVYSSNGDVIDLDYLNNQTYCMNYFLWSDPEKPNVMYAFIDVMSSGIVGKPSIVYRGIANDVGVLSINAWSTYDETGA